MNISEVVKRITFSSAYEFLDRNPEQNFLKLVDWMETLDKTGFVAKQLPTVRKYASDPSSNWYRLAQSLWDDVDDEVRKTMFTNFMLNGNVLENQKLVENRKNYQCNIPWCILMNAVQGDEELSFDEMDSIVEQGKNLGTFFYGFAGDEPVSRRNDIIALCNKNSDCVFLCVTDGTLIDEDFAQEILRVKNLIPVLTLDGFAPETDALHGPGAFARVRQAMDVLRNNRLLFVVASRYNAKNCDVLGSEAFFDSLVEWGAKGAWFTTYTPVGPQADPSLLVSAEQRMWIHQQIKGFRQTKPLLTMDHWNDGEFMGGCIAAGRGYCCISAKGDVEPCLSLQYSDSNIREKSLLDAYRAPFFTAFHNSQPFCENPLRPCPLLDHPECLNVLVDSTGAHSTFSGGEDVHTLTARCLHCAEAWSDVADHLWQQSQHSHLVPSSQG